MPRIKRRLLIISLICLSSIISFDQNAQIDPFGPQDYQFTNTALK